MSTPAAEHQPRSRRWSEDAILDAIRDFYQEHRRAPTSTEWKRATSTSPTYITVREKFGSWAAALDAAGINESSSTGRVEQLLASVEHRIDLVRRELETLEGERDGLIIALEHIADVQVGR